MADFATQTRLNGYSYHAPVFKKPESKLRDLYRETEQLVFKTQRTQRTFCVHPIGYIIDNFMITRRSFEI